MSDPKDFPIPERVLRLDPTYDLLFKYLFDDELLLTGLLNRALHLQEGELITELTYLDREVSPQHQQHRGVIFDLLVTDQRGERYEVEVQRRDEGAQLVRALYYGARLLSAQLTSSAPFAELLPVRVVMFTKFSLFPDPHPARTFYPTPYLINEESSQRPLAERTPHLEPFDLSHLTRYAQRERFKRKERELEQLRELLSVTIIELTKDFSSLTEPAQRSLQLLAHDVQEPAMNSTTKTHAQLTSQVNALKKDRLAEMIKDDPWVERFYKRLDQFAGDPQKVREYEYTERALRDHVSSLDYALQNGIEQGIEQGLEKGLKQGREEGREKGREEGLEQGREEGLEQGLERGKLLALKQSVAALKQLAQPEDEIKRLLQLTQAEYELITQALDEAEEP